MNNRKKSFTLLETLVAIYVLLVGIVGVMDVISQNLASGTVSKNQLIAANLAQEGIELVRNKRDSNFLRCYNIGGYLLPNEPNECDMDGMLTGAQQPCNNQVLGCRPEDSYDPTSNTITFVQCPPSGCGNLRQNTTNGIFGYSVGNESIFSRKIIIKPIATTISGQNPDRVDWEVRSIVSWPGRFGNSQSLEERLVLTPWLF